MDPAELKALRARLGLTQRGLSEIVGVSSNTVARWERGELPVREPIARLLRLLPRQVQGSNKAVESPFPRGRRSGK